MPLASGFGLPFGPGGKRRPKDGRRKTGRLEAGRNGGGPVAGKPKKRSQAKTTRRARLPWPWVAGIGVTALLVLLLFLANRPPGSDGFYRYSTPDEIQELVQIGEPVLVYFHSPT
ncbi:MAG: hypothetical protein H0Z37_07345 [Firmicutes bacterium]|nr:hypothetical protein [Bacillota bacterium]